MALSAIELLENLIADLEGKLNLAPGADPVAAEVEKEKGNPEQQTKKKNNKKQSNKENKNPSKKRNNDVDENIPDICKLEFKVSATIERCASNSIIFQVAGNFPISPNTRDPRLVL